MSDDAIPPAGAGADTARYMNYQEAARYLRVPDGTLRQMVSRKAIPHVRISSRGVLFEISALDAWIAARRVNPEPEQ